MSECLSEEDIRVRITVCIHLENLNYGSAREGGPKEERRRGITNWCKKSTGGGEKNEESRPVEMMDEVTDRIGARVLGFVL
jgi:hypothetical protein